MSKLNILLGGAAAYLLPAMAFAEAKQAAVGGTTSGRTRSDYPPLRRSPRMSRRARSL